MYLCIGCTTTPRSVVQSTSPYYTQYVRVFETTLYMKCICRNIQYYKSVVCMYISCSESLRIGNTNIELSS
jgi:hypothetical protein